MCLWSVGKRDMDGGTCVTVVVLVTAALLGKLSGRGAGSSSGGAGSRAQPAAPGPSGPALAFPDHTVRAGQDVAFWYKQKAEGTRREESVVFIGRVTSIRMQKGRSMVVCNGPVSLQHRPPGVSLQCAWYQELEPTEGEVVSSTHPPAFALGIPTLETGAGGTSACVLRPICGAYLPSNLDRKTTACHWAVTLCWPQTATLSSVISTVRMTRREAGGASDDVPEIPTEAPTTYAMDPSDWEAIQVFLAETAEPSRPGGASGTASSAAEGGESGAVVPMWTGRSEAAQAVFGKVVVIERLGKRAIRKVVRA